MLVYQRVKSWWGKTMRTRFGHGSGCGDWLSHAGMPSFAERRGYFVYPEIIKQGNRKPPFTSVELHRLSSCPFSSFYVGEPTTKSPNSPTEALVAGALWHRLRRCVVGLVLFDSEGAQMGTAHDWVIFL